MDATTLLLGVMLGLGAAVAHSLSYLFSRLYVLRHHSAVFRLLILGHVAMGCMSLLMLPFLPLSKLPPVEEYIGPLLLSSGFYVLGQFGTFVALRHAEASRVSPLLGLKIPMLALIYTFFLADASLSATQWAAVALALAAAFILNETGGKLPLRTVLWILFTCMAYCIADINILRLVKSLHVLTDINPICPIVTGVAMSYILLGIAGATLLPWAGKPHLDDLRFAVPWAASWLTAMLLLFGCFAVVGVVYGNILQSTRGIISILMGVGLSAIGMIHLERKVSRSVAVRRVAAATLMVLAIALYAWKW
ncbi:MAG: hypothetical protein EHM48_02200 [Planctomycetaceae bacterium]|nr:MAG: hypothetical protein EHM48_02200 [Planctomycetaceae bacterium]